MRAMVLREPGRPLELVERAAPRAAAGRVVVRVDCCAVCRTDLHVVDGELREASLPLIPGHQVVGTDATGARVGISWLAWTCGVCEYCTSGAENLCHLARFTGYTADGGFAEVVAADPRFCFPIPFEYSAEEAAPLLCAGLIGFRAYRMAGEGRRLGLYGFGSAAQIVAQIARADGRAVFAFTRDGDEEAQRFALAMGAAWSGDSSRPAPAPLDAAIIFAPAGPLVPVALRNIRRGATVVCAGIHMSDIPSFPYSLLWGERAVRTVANLTRRDGVDFFARIRALRIETRRTIFPLDHANEALAALRSGAITGTAVLDCRR